MAHCVMTWGEKRYMCSAEHMHLLISTCVVGIYILLCNEKHARVLRYVLICL